jgi:GH25 family lysozyme M1 (1,4-beta-N-acetylmuramidase)
MPIQGNILKATIKAFCKTIKAGGYYAMAYMNNYVYNSKVYIEEFAEYGIWYADYRNYLNAPYRVDMWQYTDKGKVSGIPGNVDLNVIFLENSIFAEIFK